MIIHRIKSKKKGNIFCFFENTFKKSTQTSPRFFEFYQFFEIIKKQLQKSCNVIK